MYERIGRYVRPQAIKNGARRIPEAVQGGIGLRNCKLCRFSKVCNSLPGICIILQYASIAVLLSVLGYLFVTQELLS